MLSPRKASIDAALGFAHHLSGDLDKAIQHYHKVRAANSLLGDVAIADSMCAGAGVAAARHVHQRHAEEGAGRSRAAARVEIERQFELILCAFVRF